MFGLHYTYLYGMFGAFATRQSFDATESFLDDNKAFFFEKPEGRFMLEQNSIQQSPRPFIASDPVLTIIPSLFSCFPYDITLELCSSSSDPANKDSWASAKELEDP